MYNIVYLHGFIVPRTRCLFYDHNRNKRPGIRTFYGCFTIIPLYYPIFQILYSIIIIVRPRDTAVRLGTFLRHGNDFFSIPVHPHIVPSSSIHIHTSYYKRQFLAVKINFMVSILYIIIYN